MVMKPTPDSETHPKTRLWSFGGHTHTLGRFTLVMGIVNVTPDSFSDGGEYATSESAIAHALQLVEEGADILDIGGESTRPKAAEVTLEEELARVIPVIEALSDKTNVPISIDTTKAEVARQAIQAGAIIVNDISGLRLDPEMIPLCAAHQEVGVICMHMQGTPRTMQENPHYENVVQEICDFFKERVATLNSAGIAPERIVLDPGIGFGKSAAHNLEILKGVSVLQQAGRPVLIGHSRKRFIGKLLERQVNERIWGTVGISIGLAQLGVDILRVHDVRATVDSLDAWRAVAED
ncbi:Dihydropteroate synthase [Polystyrenella longa]|uniref:Dihydropteroate synthase n=1 Tax=Polystyrenella longa TaxID=2528007 RepID=A0A518CSL8_9PLAN|nr:dihydropteroate synthase [Polystyrenella longa]QDU82227.1 Dihydropteroate synthase [Polystyrenella longa]